MLFITGPLYSGKRTYAKKFGGRQLYEVQTRAADAADLAVLADELAACDVVLPPRWAAVLCPLTPQTAPHGRPGRLACLLAARADCVVQMFCGLPTVLKGELPEC